MCVCQVSDVSHRLVDLGTAFGDVFLEFQFAVEPEDEPPEY